MPRIRLPILLLCGLLLALPAQAVTLKIATLAPDGTSWMKAMRAAGDEIRRRTEGRVKLRFYPGGVMGNNKSVLRKIRVGQLQGGALTAGELSALYPDFQIYSLPFLFRSLDEVDYVRQRVDQALIDGLARKGYIAFGLSEGGFVYLMSQTPITSVGGLKQRKVWAPEGDPISRAAFHALGISPIPLPLTDVLTGLQTGLIDTVGASPVAAIALQWHTRIKYLTDTPVLYMYGALVLQKRALKRLSPADRQVLEEVMGRTVKQISVQTRNDNVGARQALRAQGVRFVTPNPAELEEWKGIVRRSIEEMLQQEAFSPALYRRIEALLDQYRRR